MKWFAAICGSFLAQQSMSVQATTPLGIEMVSQNYSVNYPWSYTWYQPAPPPISSSVYSSDAGTFTAGSTDGTPLNAVLNCPGPFPAGLGAGISGSASMSQFSFVNHAESSASGSSHAYFDSDGEKYWVFAELQAQAGASWTFRPTTDALQVALHISSSSYYPGYQGFSVFFGDMTGGQTLLTFDENATRNQTIDVNQIFAVNPEHSYFLSVHGWTDTFAGDSASQYFSANIQAVPEPGTPALLLLGLLGLIRRGRRAAK